MIIFENQTASRLPAAILSVALATGLGACDKNSIPVAGTPDKSSGVIEQPKDSTSNPMVADNVDVDTALAARVKSALIGNPALSSFNFDVLISNGVATLYGTVDSPDSRDKAADLALNVPGVQAVRNNIQLLKNS